MEKIYIRFSVQVLDQLIGFFLGVFERADFSPRLGACLGTPFGDLLRFRRDKKQQVWYINKGWGYVGMGGLASFYITFPSLPAPRS